ncbi:MAG: tRNA lysidine(34) synthetase TilS [Ruminiclostridium sp.]|nr:tRNA lysidine(34) synthetase TilS [Ruminiclostridium sp.]
MLKPGDKVIVGLSGGADSVTLLHCLYSLRETLDIELFACHINHNLRGEDSDRDQKFAEDLCKNLDIPLRVFSVDVKGAAQKHQSTEEAARKLRYEKFSEYAEDIGAKAATAHNACDNSETVLLNLIRGTGLKGLCGIPPVRDCFIRPLICCTREEIEEYIKANSLQYVTDKTNFSTDYTRNKVRLQLMPLLLEMNPSFHRGVSRTVSALRKDSDFLEEMAVIALDDARLEEGVYSSEKLAALDPPIFSRAVSLMLWEKGVEPSALRINGFMEIIGAGRGKINLEKNRFAVVRKGRAEVQTIEQNYIERRIKNQD